MAKGFFVGILISVVLSLQVAFAVYHIYEIDEYIENSIEYGAMKLCNQFGSHLIHYANGVYECDNGRKFESIN